MKVIAISGKAESGKDTVAGMIQKLLAEQWKTCRIIHYADLLKFICRKYFGWDGKKDERGRALLQYIGTDVVRAKNPDFWVTFVADTMEFFGERWDYVVIPDVRFPNELTRLRERGFDVEYLRVDRPGHSNVLTVKQQSHASETAMDYIKPDSVILNSGSLSYLETAVKIWMEEHIYGV